MEIEKSKNIVHFPPAAGRTATVFIKKKANKSDLTYFIYRGLDLDDTGIVDGDLLVIQKQKETVPVQTSAYYLVRMIPTDQRIIRKIVYIEDVSAYGGRMTSFAILSALDNKDLIAVSDFEIEGVVCMVQKKLVH